MARPPREQLAAQIASIITTNSRGDITAAKLRDLLLTLAEPPPAADFGPMMSAYLSTLPTSSAGLSIGEWWNNGGTPAQVTEL